MKLLEVNNLSRSFGGLKAVAGVSFYLKQGAIKGVIGPNGAGKTTLFNLIAGCIRADSGEILFNGCHIENYPSHRIAAMGISRTFQNIKLCRHMTVLENVMVGCHTKSRGGMIASLLSLPFTRREEKKVREKSLKLLDTMEISDLAHEDATRLSFGQQRAVELARAMALEPSLLLLDEPAAGLNMRETKRVGEHIRRIRDTGVTILLVEHDMSLVMEISDEILVLSFGEKIAEGTPRDIRRDPEVIRIYLGDDDAQG